MYGKRFVTGDRQKACLFEQKGSYMASIKDSNGQFKTLQLGTNRPVAFKQFFAAASAAGYDMRSVAKEQGVDPEVKLNREQRRKLEKENRHMSNKAKNRKQSERLPESEMSGREAQKQPSAPQEPETLCVLKHGRLTRHQTSHGRFLFTYAPADGSDEVVKSVRGRRSEIVASFNEWYAEQEKVHEESPKCPAKVSCGHEADSVSSDAKEENSVMSGKERNDAENKINSTDETVFSIMANGPESSKPIMAFRSREDAAYFLECLQQASGIMRGDTTYSIVDLILKKTYKLFQFFLSKDETVGIETQKINSLLTARRPIALADAISALPPLLPPSADPITGRRLYSIEEIMSGSCGIHLGPSVPELLRYETELSVNTDFESSIASARSAAKQIPCNGQWLTDVLGNADPDSTNARCSHRAPLLLQR